MTTSVINIQIIKIVMATCWSMGQAITTLPAEHPVGTHLIDPEILNPTTYTLLHLS